MKILILLVLVTSSSLFAQSRNFCERNRGDILSLMEVPEARIAFKNAGGLMNGGVCWWHSRLQRSSFFLTKYAPEKAKPTPAQLNAILSGLRNMSQVVTIPGYENFESFSRAYQNEIQRVLNDWQVFDGFYNFQWIRGISGNSVLPPKEMEARMNSVYQSYRQSPAAMWIMAQMKGVVSHAFLVIGMQAVNGGYDMELIDSNHPREVVRVRYQSGDQFLQTDRGSSTFVPYVGFQEDFRKISRGLTAFCKNKTDELVLELNAVKDGDVELPTSDEIQTQ